MKLKKARGHRKENLVRNQSTHLGRTDAGVKGGLGDQADARNPDGSIQESILPSLL